MDGWNGGRNPARGRNDEPTRAMPQSPQQRARAWSQASAQPSSAPRRPAYGDEYAPTQRPEPYQAQPYRGEPYREDPYRDGPYRDPYGDPRRRGPGDGGSGKPPRGTPRRRRPHWGRRIGIVFLILILAIVGFTFYLDSTLHRTEALADYPGRIANTPGTNWLMVGSDSRAGLTPEQERALSTGSAQDAGGSRTDTIMILHIPSGSGDSTLVSVPRDSEVSIPGHGKDKVNAAFALGGAPLLVRTLEQATKVHIDHYAEIGFGGFANMVDAVGGVNICIDPPGMNDPFSGAHFAPGCQDLTGAQALAYVRDRHDFPDSDVTRVKHQRQFLSALLAKTSSAGTVLNPFTLFPMLTSGTSSFTVDSGDHIWNLVGLGWAMRGGLVTTTVPFDGGSQWTANAAPFWAAIAADKQVPKNLLSGK